MIYAVIGIVAVVVVLLGVLVFYLWDSSPKQKKDTRLTLPQIKMIAKDKTATSQKLQACADRLLEFDLTEETKGDVLEALYLLTLHKNSNKNIIMALDKGLKGKNASLKNDINIAIKAGLDGRK